MSTRIPLIAGNWKLHNGLAESAALATALKQQAGASKAELVVAPVFTALDRRAAILKDTGIGVSAQDVYPKPSGAFTGEVSAPLLRDAGCSYCIVGHSERRQLFGETDESVREKVAALLAEGLKPIVCVGETQAERESGDYLKVILGQLDGGLSGLTAEQLGPVVIAYEPVWAIGTGLTAKPEDAQAVHASIRGWAKSKHGDAFATSLRILYGGSVKPDNATELMGQADIDGALVGGASLKADAFMAIASAVG